MTCTTTSSLWCDVCVSTVCVTRHCLGHCQGLPQGGGCRHGGTREGVVALQGDMSQRRKAGCKAAGRGRPHKPAGKWATSPPPPWAMWTEESEAFQNILLSVRPSG